MDVDDTTVRDEATRLVAQMTLEEKAGLTSGADFWHTKAVERLGLAAVMLTDGPHGLRKQVGGSDHIGLTTSVPATCFPTAAALGSTWDPGLLRRVGTALGEESRANDVAVLLGPGLNMKRSPLCGRNFEYLSEDPLVAGRAGAALVEGIQSRGVGASVKHFAANNQETDRMRVSADVDERTLREIYLPAFEHVVTTARPWTLMCSYNRINGVYASQNRWLLRTVLREEWGYQGLVMSDWGAVDDRLAGLVAGLDLEMPSSGGDSDARIVAAVRDGTLDESVLDLAAARMTTLLLRARAAMADGVDVDAGAHHALAREVAAAGAVLLRNDVVGEEPVLPLDPAVQSSAQPLVVIGEFARTPRYQGAGSSQINPTRLDAALDCLREALGDDAVRFEPGFHLAEAEGLPGQELSTERLAHQAVEAARGADVVLFAGLPAADESEGYDRTTLDLPVEQVEVIHRVAAVARRSVVVLSNGSVVRLSDWEQEVDAVLECWLGGQAGGAAVADILLGARSPSGRLAESIPVSLSDVPAQLNFPGADGHVRYGEGIYIGYRGLDAMEQPVSHPFGFGLSYTSFRIDEVRAPGHLQIAADMPAGEVVATVSARVTNTGRRPGAHVVQLYLGRTGDSRVPRAVRELRGFARIVLDPGQSERVELPLTRRDLSYWDVVSHDWLVEPGRWEISVGASSRDLEARLGLDVDAPPLIRRIDADSTLAQWAADPVASALLAELVPGGVGRVASDSATVQMMGATPLLRLLRMSSVPDAEEVLQGLLARLRNSSRTETDPQES